MRYFIAPIQPKKGGYALLCSAYIQVMHKSMKISLRTWGKSGNFKFSLRFKFIEENLQAKKYT